MVENLPVEYIELNKTYLLSLTSMMSIVGSFEQIKRLSNIDQKHFTMCELIQYHVNGYQLVSLREGRCVIHTQLPADR